MQHPRFFSWPPLSWRALARLWTIGALLPFLLLSIAGNVPHDHELRTLSALVQHPPGDNRSQASPLAASVQPKTHFSIQLAPPILSHPGEALCLLCQWASVTGALLFVALSLLWLGARDQTRVFIRSHRLGLVALSLRSRAPPV